MGNIETVEREFITGEHLMLVSFQLNYSDWCRLSKKKYWKKMQKFIRKTGNVSYSFRGGEKDV